MSCPTEDPQYSLLEDTCIYFEQTHLTYDEADTNCKSKMMGKGKLFEPNSLKQNNQVANMANQIFAGTLVAFPHIGIKYNYQEDLLTYNSVSIVRFQPRWFDNKENIGYDCVNLALSPRRLGKWSNKPCSQKRSSICQEGESFCDFFLFFGTTEFFGFKGGNSILLHSGLTFLVVNKIFLMSEDEIS